jgi:nitrogen fixation NifU-like protein
LAPKGFLMQQNNQNNQNNQNDNNNGDLQDLYQALILDHNKNPRNFKKNLGECCISREGYNPVCGDHYFIHVLLDQDQKIIEDFSFEGEGCAISKASASLMGTFIKGQPKEKALVLFDHFHALLTGASESESKREELKPTLGKLMAFTGIFKYPARVKCAALPWHTLKAALVAQDNQPVQTE